MAQFVKVVKVADVLVGRGRAVDCAGKKVALFNVDGTFHAIDNTCLHRGGPLGEGELAGCFVTCPWHGWEYDVRTGETAMKEGAHVVTYRVRVEGDDVKVEV